MALLDCSISRGKAAETMKFKRTDCSIGVTRRDERLDHCLAAHNAHVASAHLQVLQHSLNLCEQNFDIHCVYRINDTLKKLHLESSDRRTSSSEIGRPEWIGGSGASGKVVDGAGVSIVGLTGPCGCCQSPGGSIMFNSFGRFGSSAGGG